MTRRSWVWLLRLAGAALPIACVDLSKNDIAPTTWQATLVPAPGYPGFAGQAAAVVSSAGTDAGIGVSGATPGATHIWALYLGDCGAPGQQIGQNGDYPVLVVSDSGTASAETVLGTELLRDGSYTVVVRVSATDSARMACGDLARR